MNSINNLYWDLLIGKKEFTHNDIIYTLEIGYIKNIDNNNIQSYFRLWVCDISRNKLICGTYLFHLINNELNEPLSIPLTNKIIEIANRMEKMKAFI